MFVKTNKMKAVFETKDEQEALRLANSSKMASFIWELKHNAWRKFKATDYDYQPAWELINQMLEEEGIDIDSLWS